MLLITGRSLVSGQSLVSKLLELRNYDCPGVCGTWVLLLLVKILCFGMHGADRRHMRHIHKCFFLTLWTALASKEPLDFRAYSSSLRVAEQRTSWVVNLPEAQLSMLKASGCNRARSFEECLQQWGVRNIPKSFVVFTSLGQILHLLVRQKWAVLPDMARCTPRLIRFPKGGQGSLSLSQD